MKRLLLVPVVPIVAFGLYACSEDLTSSDFTPPDAQFQSAKFTASGAKALSASLVGNNLVISFKISGLASQGTYTIEVTGDVDREDICRNNGGNTTGDPKKTELQQDVLASGDFTAGKNGSIEGSLTVFLVDTTLTCPSDQWFVDLLAFSYENIFISAFQPAGSETLIAGPTAIPGGPFVGP